MIKEDLSDYQFFQTSIILDFLQLSIPLKPLKYSQNLYLKNEFSNRFKVFDKVEWIVAIQIL